MMVIEPLYFLLIYFLIAYVAFTGGRMYQWYEDGEGRPENRPSLKAPRFSKPQSRVSRPNPEMAIKARKERELDIPPIVMRRK